MMKINFNKIIKKLINFYPFIIFFIIIIYVTRKFLFKDENMLYGEFFGSTNYFFFLKEFLNAWGTYTTFGQSNIGLTTSYGLNPVFWILPPAYNIPFLFLLSFFQLIFGSFTMKVYILLSLILPFIGMYFFARFWFKKVSNNLFILNSLSFISALVYSINVMMGDRISAGHQKYNLAHGLFPLLFLFTFKSIEENNPKARKLFVLASGLIIGILIWLMPHLLSLYIIVMGFYFIIFVLGDKKKVVRFFIVTFLAVVTGILLNIHVWLPALFFKAELAYIADPQYVTSYVYQTSYAIKLINLITLASGFEQQFIKKIIYENLILLKLILPTLAVIGLILNKEKRKSLFLFLVGLTGIIFSLGVNYPFEKIYNFLFENFFLFKPFREVGKFAILYLFSLSLLISYVFFYVSRFLNKKILFLTLLIFTFFILYINPNFTSGNFGMTIVPFKLPEKYQRLSQFLSKTDDDYRVAIYPNNQTIFDYDWMPKVANGSPYANIFFNLFPLSKNLAISNKTITDWSSRYLDYIESNLDQSWAVERLGEEMTRYIIVDHSLSNYAAFFNLLKNNPTIKKNNEINGLTIFGIKNYNQKILKEKPAVYYYGDIKGIKNLPSDLALINLGLNSTTDILSKNYSNNVVLYDSSLDDVFYSSLNKFNFSFFPEVRFTKDGTKEFYIPGEYLREMTLKGISFYNPEIIATNGPNHISKQSNLSKGKYKILLSSLNYENLFTNAIKVTIDNTVIKRTKFSKKNNTFEWVDFGDVEIKNDNPMIAVENLEDNSVYLDYLLIIPVDQYKKLQEDFYSVIRSKEIITLGESESLNIDSLKQNQKSIYVFSQSFSPYWKICDRSVFRVNFFATGVACDKKTNLNPQFEPDLLYKFSIILSGTFYILIFWQIVKFIKSEKKHENRS